MKSKISQIQTIVLASIVSLAFLLPLCSQTLGDTCPKGKVVLNTQKSINNFSEEYRNCNEIGGDLEISGEDINNLNALENITSVKGDLIIWYNPILESLEGLSNIDSIYGLTIWYNNKLETIEPLSKISGDIRSHLDISFNESLTSISALSGVTSVHGNIYLEGNPRLLNLLGLGNFSRAKNLFVWDNIKLDSLDGLERIIDLESDLSIIDNPNLSNCVSISLLLGWPKGPPGDGVQGKIILHNNGPTCNSIGDILSLAPYKGVEEIRLPATSCRLKSSFEETPITQNEAGTFNSAEGVVEIACPVPLKAHDHFSDARNAVTDVSIHYISDGHSEDNFECSIFEYSGSRLIRVLAGETSSDAQNPRVHWDRLFIDESSLTSLSIICSLPKNINLSHIRKKVFF